jgi:hypothetical protein
MGHDPPRQADLSGRKPGDDRGEDGMGAGLQQRQQAQLGKAAAPTRGRRTAEVPLQHRQIGDIDRCPVEADQPATLVPRARCSRIGQRLGEAAEQLTQWGLAQTYPGLGDGRLADQVEGRALPPQPAQPFHQFAQHGVIRGVSVKRQSHHVVNHDARQPVSRSPIPPPGLLENLVHHGHWHGFGQDTKCHMLVELPTLNTTATLLAHGRSLHPPSTSSTTLSTKPAPRPTPLDQYLM